MRAYSVVVNDCSAVRATNLVPVRTRDTANGRKNFNYSFDDLAAGLPDPLTERQLDWLEILVAIYATDLMCERGEDSGWGRDIELHVPVRDPDYWDQFAVALGEIFMDLSGDRLRIFFHADDDPRARPRQGPAFPASDCVALLSGGVDSFAGALDLLADHRRPLFLSHYAGAIRTPQVAVQGVLLGVESNLAFTHIAAQVDRSRWSVDEPSQRGRSLLFMGVAAMAATAIGSAEVYLNENGIMAVHLPVTEARVGSYSTKTAAPAILDAVGGLATRALGEQVAVQNLLVDNTKPEVVSRVVQHGQGAALELTASCWRWGRSRRHCGRCIPCIQRRISFEIHGVPDKTPEHDVFGDPDELQVPQTQDNLGQLCDQLLQLESLDAFALEITFSDLLMASPAMTLVEAIDLYKRWTDQALGVLRGYPNPQTFLP